MLIAAYDLRELPNGIYVTLIVTSYQKICNCMYLLEIYDNLCSGCKQQFFSASCIFY